MIETSDIGINVKAYDQASGVLNHVGGRLGMLGKQGLAVGVGIVGVQMAVQGAMKAFQGLQQWIGESITKFREFETSMAEVSTMLDTQTMKYLPDLEKGIVDLANTYGKSANGMAKAMYQVLSASVEAGDALNFLEIATKAATAGLTTTEVAVDAITSVMNAYGMSVAEAARISDIMFQTVKRGKLRFEDLANTISMAAPIASQAGISFEELSAAIATLTRQGINASKATMSLRQLISNIINPATEASDAAASFGISLDALHFRVVGISGILKEMTDAADGNIAVLGQFIPNIRALQAALGLTGDSADGFTKDIDLMGDSLGKTQEALEKIIGTSGFMVSQVQALSDEVDRITGESLQKFDLQMKILGSSFKAAAVDMGEFYGGLSDTELAANLLVNALSPIIGGLMLLSGVEQSNININDKLTDSQNKVKKSAEDEWNAMNSSVNIFEKYGEQFIKYGTAVEQFNTDMENIGETTDETFLALQKNAEGYNMIQGALDSVTGKLQDTQTTIVLLDAAIDTLNIDIPKMVDNIAKLELVRTIENDLYRAQMALKDFSYAGEYADTSVDSMVSNLVKYGKHLDELRQKQDAFNLSSKKNSLEILKIQYEASGRRGRLNRTERKQIEELERANLKNRIEQMSGDIEATEYKKRYYDVAETEYKNYITSQQHLLSQLKDTRQESLDNLDDTLTTMLDLKEDYLNDLDIMNAREVAQAAKLKNDLAMIAGIYASQGLAIPVQFGGAAITKRPEWSWMDKVKGQHQTGISSVPSTGWYKLHEGESVTTKGATNAGGGGRVTVDLSGNLNVNVTKTLGAGDDPEAWVAKKISDGVRRGLITTDIDTLYG